MATANIKIAGATYEDVPSVTLTKSDNQEAEFFLTSDATGTSSDLREGMSMYDQNGKVFGSLQVHTVYVGAATPSASLGENGDIYLKVV